MRLVFVLLCMVIIHAIEEKKQPKTPSPTEQEVYELCLDLHKISINGMKWDSGSSTFWAQTEGIFYTYNDQDSVETFKSLKFPIIAEPTSQTDDIASSLQKRRLQNVDTSDNSQKENANENALPTEFKFKGDDKKVGCWIEPQFHELNVRFKLYQFYHTALKAVTIVTTPSIQSKSEKATVTLNTLPYQYSEASIDIEYELKWFKKKLSEATADVNKYKAPPVPPTPIAPVQPPVDADAIIDVEKMFDSVDVPDDIVTADQDDKSAVDKAKEDMKEIKDKVEEEGDKLKEEGDKLGDKLEEEGKKIIDGDNKDDTADFVMPQQSHTDWMFIAALCSSMLGLFVLVYICIWAYKSFGRKEYEQIGNKLNGSGSSKLNKVRKISLRSSIIGIVDDEEQRNIMHPSKSYTFS